MMFPAACKWCLYINHEAFLFQRLRKGAKKGDLDAVEEALAEGANVDVGVSLHGSIPPDFSADDVSFAFHYGFAE